LQRIEVLQLQALDLVQMIEQELQENETLELSDDGEPEPADAESDEWEDSYDDLEREERPTRDREAPTRMDVMEATAAAPVTLQDHLRKQLNELELSARERILGLVLVDGINDRGWLEASLEDLGDDLDPPARTTELEHVLHVVQGLDPAGVGARDMTECLLLQLDADDPDYDLLVTMVVQHLEDIARNRIPRIARETGASVEDVLAAIDAISHLDPIPGRRFGAAMVPHVNPDIVVTQVGDDYEISLERAGVPSVTLSRSYLNMAADRSVDPALRKHIRGKIESARSLIEAIEQRRNTLFRVASELVNRQHDYIEHGPSALHPLRMQDVADSLGVHVSTVSRAISGKYMQLPHGIVPLKSLFAGEVPTRAGDNRAEGASRTSVQEQVRDIIGGEDGRHPLSDEAIVQILKDGHGIDIARRTVTKYRKALKIGSSRARRVYGPA
jgi:RNA polymerase sigma-54 factor